MDNTELHYVQFDPKELWDEMTLRYVEAGGDILYPGDEKEMLLRAVQADIVQSLGSVDNALRMQTLRYAVGEYLDVLGENRGCSRIKASPAHATVNITTAITGRADVLTAGTTMTADGQQFYELVEDFPLPGVQQTAPAVIRAVEAGSAGNGLLSGTPMHLSMSNAGVLAIVAATDAAGGNEQEEDEVYRERIREYGFASVTTGPEQQYEAAAMAVSSEVLDANAVKIDAGHVGVYVVLSDDTHAAAILQEIQDALPAENVRPLTDYVTVHQAESVPYTLKVEYKTDGSSAVTSAIAAAVNEYQAWQDNTIGRPFNPDRLMAAIYQAGATRVTWGEESNFNSGAVEYTEITETQRCKGSITLSALPS